MSEVILLFGQSLAARILPWIHLYLELRLHKAAHAADFLVNHASLSYLLERIPQLFHPDHVGSLSQQFGPHQLHKVLKVHVASHWWERKTGLMRPRVDSETRSHERPTHGSCWSAGSVLSAPSPWACTPSSSCSSPDLCIRWSRLCLCRTPWRPPSALRKGKASARHERRP